MAARRLRATEPPLALLAHSLFAPSVAACHQERLRRAVQAGPRFRSDNAEVSRISGYRADEPLPSLPQQPIGFAGAPEPMGHAASSRRFIAGGLADGVLDKLAGARVGRKPASALISRDRCELLINDGGEL